MTRRALFLLGGGAAAAACAAPRPAPEFAASFEDVSAWPPLGSFVSVAGEPVHYWEKGEGAPVVLLHGASGNLRDWTFGPAAPLAEAHRVIAFDRPGFGYSGRPATGAAGPVGQARILRAALAEIGAERPVIVGHSYGAAVALAWALEAPGEVAGIVSVSGAVMPYDQAAVRVAESLGLTRRLVGLYTSRMLESAANGGVEAFLDRVFRPLPTPEGYLEHVGAPLALRASTLAANAEDLAGINQALRRMAPHYASIEVPVEIVHGAADFIDPRRHAIGLADRIEGARVALLPGVGHMAHHAAPQKIREAVERILKA